MTDSKVRFGRSITHGQSRRPNYSLRLRLHFFRLLTTSSRDDP